MDEERVFSLSYEQLTRFAERRIRECNLEVIGMFPVRGLAVYFHPFHLRHYHNRGPLGKRKFSHAKRIELNEWLHPGQLTH
ncbi:hypothetical protein AAGZ85_004880 [Escherichia coli]|nr:hypothetical protein [Escherichia coli]EGW4274304.1 hypothetical protein [Salmonella enterica subsp. enterica serovar Typhimurium]EKJ2376356.1 hypothetical protein [Salmonella enterica]EHX7463258.1 hypothetical protein [Escherichia coli]EJX6202155.1 hypothetical protein [Escherichia coli]GDF11787.1 hypothetical protein BvCmsKKNP002_02226 [Escherichia coli]